jgi:hypothetical protein
VEVKLTFSVVVVVVFIVFDVVVTVVVIVVAIVVVVVFDVTVTVVAVVDVTLVAVAVVSEFEADIISRGSPGKTSGQMILKSQQSFAPTTESLYLTNEPAF